MKISAEGFDYDKKWDIDGSRYNVLLKFRYNKKTKSIFNIEICLKMNIVIYELMLMSITKTHRKFKPMLAGKGSSRSDRLNILSDQTFYIYLCYPIVNP